MDIRKIILEEVNDFEWASEVKPAYQLSRGVAYTIDTCDTGYDEGIVRDKLIQLVGDNWIDSDDRTYVNWFDNEYIVAESHKINLEFTLRGTDGGSFGWNQCGQSIGKLITMDVFLNSSIEGEDPSY